MTHSKAWQAQHCFSPRMRQLGSPALSWTSLAEPFRYRVDQKKERNSLEGGY